MTTYPPAINIAPRPAILFGLYPGSIRDQFVSNARQ